MAIRPMNQKEMSNIPMVTADGKDIHINMAVYRPLGIINSRYFDKNEKPHVEGYRVFFIDNIKRVLRMRCPKGREEWVSFEGCAIDPIYSSFEAAKRFIVEHYKLKESERKSETLKYIDGINKDLEWINSKIKLVKSLKFDTSTLPEVKL